MKEYTKLDAFLDFIWRDRVRAVEYFFAKRWLDKNFGRQEYWGEIISELLIEESLRNIEPDTNDPSQFPADGNDITDNK